ncbi:MAG: hypothetical protein EBU90_21435 [Proteobacteria bacterium]|nr:hypothetical protein [Pseudomonadota bacterium]
MGWSFMTVAVSTEKRMADNGREDRSVLPSNYGCEILLEKTTVETAKDSSFPNDAYLIWYNLDGKDYIDLVRGTRVRIFDMYYDKYGPGSVQKIDFGYGRTNPKLWGYKQPEKKKRK